MAPEVSKLVGRLTFALVALAACAVELAAFDTRAVLASFGIAAMWVATAAVVAWLMPRPTNPAEKPSWLVGMVLLGGAVSPFVVEPIRRMWTNDGYPFELLMVFALQNMGLALAACSGWILCLRLACVVSLFLMLFSAAMTDHPAVMGLLATYTITGSVWLMLVYWTGLKNVLIPTEKAVTIEVRERERLPWLALLSGGGILAMSVALIVIGPQQTAQALGEWFPTSGGTGAYDPFARGGVNDGDDETRGDNPQSTGMTQTDMFLESPLPSLYDVVNETFGKPFKNKEQERMIALDPKTKFKESHEKSDNLRPNREFPTSRKGPRRHQHLSSRAGRALFEIQGRTPLHVRVAAYDRFNGVSWREAPVGGNQFLIEKEPNSNWMSIAGRTPPAIFASPDRHKFKITAKKEQSNSLIPTPPHLVKFKVGRVDRTDFFSRAQDRILRFADRKTPSGIIVETVSNSVDPRLLGNVSFSFMPSGERFDYDKLPTINPKIRDLAQDWASHLPRGHEQITAIVERLRQEYTLDREYTIPDDCADPLSHFLLEAKRGPDYQFASAAAVLLRVLNYPTRVVMGFYAAPENYDPLSRHTPVVAEDLHMWPEVMLPTGDWLLMEPTPGYELLGPNPSWVEWLALQFWAILAWLRDWVMIWLPCVVVGSWLVVRRREWIDTVAALWWMWFPGKTWREQVRGALSVLERRGRYAGRGRGHQQTVRGWLREALPTQPSEIRSLAQMSEWAAYAPDLPTPWPQNETLSLCRRLVAEWSLERWRKSGEG